MMRNLQRTDRSPAGCGHAFLDGERILFAVEREKRIGVEGQRGRDVEDVKAAVAAGEGARL